LPSSVEQFRKWLRHARRKDRLVYYEGFIMFDRGSDNRDTRTAEQSEIARLADVVREAHESGFVTMIQKRNGPGNYSYIAQKR
jgi:hypothetical protein